jgi:hypothetical protein
VIGEHAGNADLASGDLDAETERVANTPGNLLPTTIPRPVCVAEQPADDVEIDVRGSSVSEYSA